jgi:hypothetical protein
MNRQVCHGVCVPDGELNPVPRATWVTKGIVSTVRGDDFQTDAQINHGTSGAHC